jgi:arginase
MLSKNVVLVSIPEWRGAGRRGTELAPEAFKKFGLQEKLQAAGVGVSGSYQVDLSNAGSEYKEEKGVKYESEIADMVRSSFFLLRRLIYGGNVIVVLGGDHTVSFASVAAQVGYAEEYAMKTGLIWIDAHGDVHTPDTTPSGNVHGMPLATLLGHGSKKFSRIGGKFFMKMSPGNVVHIGANNLEREEAEFFEKHKIPLFLGSEIATDEGFARACDAITDLGKKVERVVVSIDMDGFDETIAPAVHARNKNGITRERAMALLGHIKSHCNVVGIDITEIVPRKDRARKTVELAYDFLLRLLTV